MRTLLPSLCWLYYYPHFDDFDQVSLEGMFGPVLSAFFALLPLPPSLLLFVSVSVCLSLSVSLFLSLWVCVRVCVRERERECVCVCARVCVCVAFPACMRALNLENMYIWRICKRLGPVRVMLSKYPLLFRLLLFCCCCWIFCAWSVCTGHWLQQF